MIHYEQKKKKKLELENMKHLCDKWSGMCLQLQQYGRKDCPKGGFNSQRSLFIYYSLLFLFVLVCITLVLRFPPDSFAFYHHQVFFFFFNSVLKLISIFWKYKCGGGVWGDWVGRCDDDDDEIRSPRRWLWQKKKNRTWINKKNSTPRECNIIFSGGGRLHVMSRRAHWPTKIIMTSTQSKICFHCSALCPFCVSWELFWRCFDASWEKAVVVTLLFFFPFFNYPT